MSKRNPVITGGFVLLGVLIMTTGWLLVQYFNRPRGKSFTPDTIKAGTEDKVIIYGRHFPEPGQIEVYFSNTKGIIVGASEDSLLVEPYIPLSPESGMSQQKVYFSVIIKKRIIYSAQINIIQ